MQMAAYISTGFALLVLALSVLSVVACARFAQRCQELCDELRQSRGRLIANEQSLTAMHSRLQSMDGRISRMKRGESPPAENGALDSDDELRDLLALQGAPAASPGSKPIGA